MVNSAANPAITNAAPIPTATWPSQRRSTPEPTITVPMAINDADAGANGKIPGRLAADLGNRSRYLSVMIGCRPRKESF
jgi:hypothetical protein